MSVLSKLGLLLAATALGGCAHHPPDEPSDPLEPMNRVIFKVNDKADQYVLHPVAKGYVAITPALVRRGISNFFSNLGEPRTIVNDLLQAKFLHGASDLGRFLLNSTAGLAGFIDVATPAGLEKHDEDFGQTLGYWGVGEGWFLMLPFLGPSDNRDLVGSGADIFTSPTYYLPGRYDLPNYLISYGLYFINLRANLLPSDSLMESQFDTYLFIRTAYLEHRQALVYDGNPPPEDLGDSADDSSAPAAAAPEAATPTKK